MDSYRVLVSEGTAEIIEKKSRFIANVRSVKTEAEAFLYLEEIRKKYWDARHHCYAYVIGENGEHTRCSDDGEPSGTAGRPMLEVLLNKRIQNVLVVVTRYFGGVLLGTGGLVRAYSQAAKEGILACRLGFLEEGVGYRICADYNDVGKILRITEKYGITQGESEYGERFFVNTVVAGEREQVFLKEIMDATCGRAELEKTGNVQVVREEEQQGKT